MTAKALLDKTPQPSREDISEAISGNLCRCTGYIKIVDAIDRAAKELHEQAEAQRNEERPLVQVASKRR
jgi:carbon-monoxide dehydrogenase small subunit